MPRRAAPAWLLLPLLAAAPGQAVAADPSSAVAHNDLAWYLLQSGRTDEALLEGRRAIQLEPGSAPILDTLAAIAEARGDCAIGLEIQRRALELLPEGTPESGRSAYRERLARLDKRCGAGSAAPAGR
ncbi:MAG TPA: tetratricopeptide repeat protein [Anaeromyxobacteraceae bacterium]|nr:tetratricopeptide repeat protein [Anaeromyxobacteraceae bacterium]